MLDNVPKKITHLNFFGETVELRYIKKRDGYKVYVNGVYDKFIKRGHVFSGYEILSDDDKSRLKFKMFYD